MATLSDIKPSITAMSRSTLQAHIAAVRQSRREPAQKRQTRKQMLGGVDIAKWSPEDREKLKKALEKED